MRNIPTQSLVTLLQPEEFNDLANELENIITSAGITLSQSDLFQLGKATATYSAGGDFYTDSGAANAYVLSAIGSKQTPEAYFIGMRVRYLPENANTGASTVNVNSLGVINIKKADGVSDPSSGDISTTELQLTYDGTNFRIVELSGAAASPDTLDVNQTTHGFSVNDIIRVSGGAYTEALADTVANAQAIGVVVAVGDVDNFTVQFSGFTNLLTGLSANTLHYLDATTPGANTTTEPTISKPIVFAVSSTTGWILPQRPIDTSVTADAIAFRANFTGSQSLLNQITTKIPLNGVDFDTDSWFDTVTDNRYVPLKAGYYSFFAQVFVSTTVNGGAGDDARAEIQKNGTSTSIQQTPTVSGDNPNPTTSAVVFMNGTTDFIELFGRQSGGGTESVDTDLNRTFLSGFFIGN